MIAISQKQYFYKYMMISVSINQQVIMIMLTSFSFMSCCGSIMLNAFSQGRSKQSGWSGFGRTTISQGKTKFHFTESK